MFVETEHTFPLAERVKAVLADPSAFVAADGMVRPPMLLLLLLQAKVEAKEGSKESDQDKGFGLFD